VLIPARAGSVGPDALPPDYQRILTIVCEAAGPVKVKEVGGALGLPIEVWSKLEPLRGKLRKLADGRCTIAVAAGQVRGALVVAQHREHQDRDPPRRQGRVTAALHDRAGAR
jgi:hypothetical protein